MTQHPIEKTSGAKMIAATPTANNIIVGDAGEYLCDTAPAMTNASPLIMHKMKKTTQKICDLFEEILLLMLLIDSRNSC